jgi:SAM-dependent methyltransferase
MSEDALQYAPDKEAAFAEASRILRPSGRLVFTAYELAPDRAANLPILGADMVSDYRPVLEAAGFAVEIYDEVPGWPEPMTTTYAAVIEAKETLTQEMGEAAVGALVLEMSLTLEHRPYSRRVFVSATRR